MIKISLLTGSGYTTFKLPDGVPDLLILKEGLINSPFVIPAYAGQKRVAR
jgi:hypothetical protein